MEDGIPYKAYMYAEGATKPEVRRFCMYKVDYGKMRPLKAKLREVYPKLKMKYFTVAWKDEDGDEVLMSTDDEVKTMLSECHEAVLKLLVRVIGSRNSDNDDVPEASTAATAGSSARSVTVPFSHLHLGVNCHACNRPVTGFRYRCISCDDFDLCVRCENEGRHPDHCVVRVPGPNMSVPLIKASIKKSRRFLKTLSTQAHEENKRLRRERCKHSTDGIQGKQDSQPRPSRNWVEIFGNYMEEFTNLAGDFSRYTEKKPEPVTKAASPQPGTSAETAPNKCPTNEEISLNPWGLPQEDLEKLQHACRYVRDNALTATSRAFGKVLEIAATVAEEAAAQSPGRASSPVREVTARKVIRATRQAELEAQRARQAAKQETLKAAIAKAQDVPKVVQEQPKAQDIPKVEQEEETTKQEASGQLAADSVKADQEMTIEKPTSGTATSEAAKDVVERRDSAELVNEVADSKTDMSSTSSSCSSEGLGSDKAEEWTVIEPTESDMKDLLDHAANFTANMNELPVEIQEQNRYHAPIYPPLNTATAVLDPNEDVAASASAPPMPKADRTKAKISPNNLKPDQAAAAAQAIGKELAPHVLASVRQMEAMGFCNDSGWLTQLLEHHDGNIAAVLDLITPVIPVNK